MNMGAEKSYTCKGDELNEEHEKKHSMMLDLSSQKSNNIFAGADQTPTPTRLIRNCEEVGLFEDLRHVNPFDETFRRAVEQKSGQTPSTPSHPEEDSLHTPQVFPQIEVSGDAGGFHGCEMLQKPLDSPTSAAVTLDVPVVEDLLREVNSYKLSTSRQNSDSSTSSFGYGKLHKYRSIVEKPSPPVAEAGSTFVQLPSNASIQMIQPQVITLSFPSDSEVVATSGKANLTAIPAIPVQTVKPFILPKLTPTTTVKQSSSTSTSATTASASQPPTHNTIHEPSSASLTPTSQLPIKERLKAILSHSSKSQIIELPQKSNGRRARGSLVKSQKYDDDCIERRRAAATRYRNKMRNEHKDLRRQNIELQTENEKLRERVKQLELELAKRPYLTSANGNMLAAQPAQIQLPPSTVHLVMNIPKLLVPSNEQPFLQNRITYSVEKK